MRDIIRYFIISIIITLVIGSILNILSRNFDLFTYGISFIYSVFITFFSAGGIKIFGKLSIQIPSVVNYLLIGIVLILSSSIGTLLATGIIYKIFPVKLHLEGLQSLLYVNIIVTIVIGMILVSGVKLYNLYQNAEFNLRKKEIETLKLEKEKAEAELKFYQSQLNPHFLFNTLNTLAGLIRLDPRQAEKMIEVLSDYYRAVLNLSNVMIIPLKNEILLVENYLKLLKIRFGNRLYYELDIQRKCENFPVPALILQPIVENSVKHGNRTTNGETRIIIHAALKEQYDEPVLILQVKDNGPGFDSIPVETSSGLSITYKKLKLLYKDKASINVKTENGAVVTIIIPFYRPGE